MHPKKGLQRSKTGTHDDFVLQDSPHLMSWIGAVLKTLTKGHPHGHLFEFNCTNFLEQFRISRQRLGLDDLVPYQMRHPWVSIDMNSKFRSLQKALDNMCP